jgi:antitoxin (DNA-binding transcriptional repressor) of toxin-antitoxin stability system
MLKTEHELVITRDGQAVARLVRIIPTKTKRTRFDPVEHATWQARVFGKGKLIRWVDQALAQARADRKLAR